MSLVNFDISIFREMGEISLLNVDLYIRSDRTNAANKPTKKCRIKYEKLLIFFLHD